jgi:tryptophanyl-tRNA synthetase
VFGPREGLWAMVRPAMRILSGVQSSGKLHIGNYYGALRQFVELQHEAEAFYFIANYHSLTTVRDAGLQTALTREAAMAYLALGLDPAKATLFRQSDVPEVLELYWVLGTVVPVSNLERAHSFKDKTAKGIAADFGLFAYPVLMAADILLYDTDLVPVGKDQIQHVEFARDWATKFNVTFQPRYDPQDPTGAKSGVPGILKLPGVRVQESTATVPGIDGQKMSKSYGNTIDLFGDEKEIKKRIMGVKTDSTAVEAPKPLDSPLYSLLKVMAPAQEMAELDVSWRSGGKGYGDYKKKLLEYFHGAFDGPRQRYAELSADPGEIERILRAGAERAREKAAEVIGRVRRTVGLPT